MESMPYEFFGTVVNVIAIFILCISLLRGIFRKTERTVVSLINAVVSAVLAYICAINISGFSSGMITDAIYNAINQGDSDIPDYILNNGALKEFIGGVILAFVKLFGFVLWFFLFLILTGIIGAIVVAIVRKKLDGKTSPTGKVPYGIIPQLLRGIIVVLVVFLPLGGLIGSASEVMAELAVTDEANFDADFQDARTVIDAHLMENPVIKAENSSFCKKIYNSLLSFDYNGESFELEEETVKMVSLYADLSSIDTDSEELSAEDMASLFNLLGEIKDNRLITEVLADSLSEMVKDAIKSGAQNEVTEFCQQYGIDEEELIEFVDSFSAESLEKLTELSRSALNITDGINKYEAGELDRDGLKNILNDNIKTAAENVEKTAVKLLRSVIDLDYITENVDEEGKEYAQELYDVFDSALVSLENGEFSSKSEEVAEFIIDVLEEAKDDEELLEDFKAIFAK